MDLEMNISQRHIVGAAILVEENGKRMLIYSDTIRAGTITLIQETYDMESDDRMIASRTRVRGFQINLIGDGITIRRGMEDPIGKIIELSDQGRKLLESKDKGDQGS